tara:strand:- start:100 stop:456 length:357 start_codon:yes stop_codon:yes gene_type:complete
MAKTYDFDIIDACDLDNILKAGNNITITKLDDCTLEISPSGVDGLANYYKVFTYTSGSLTKIETYSDSTLSSKLFTKNLTYSSGVLTKLEFTNETTALTETKDFTYDGSGNLINIEKS